LQTYTAKSGLPQDIADRVSEWRGTTLAKTLRAIMEAYDPERER